MIDQIQDVNNEALYGLATVVELPAFVKEARHISREEATELESTAFADPVGRMYPIHTKADTWLSAAYLRKYGHESARSILIEQKLQDACTMWGIDPPSKSSLAGTQKVATEVMSIKYRVDGDIKHEVVVSSPEELRKVASDIQDRARYPWAMRQDVSRQILAAPLTFRAGIPLATTVSLQKSAGYGIGDLTSCVTAINLRKTACRSMHPEFADTLEKTAGLVQKASPHGLVGFELLNKIAGLLDSVDRLASLHDRTPAPEHQLFSLVLAETDVFDKMAVRLQSGDYLHRQDILNADVPTFLKECLGEKLASKDDLWTTLRDLPPRKGKLVAQHVRDHQVA